MVFSSYLFICAFLPVVLIGYYGLSFLKSNVWQKLFLIVSSLFFYGYYSVKYLLLILASIAVNYLAAICMSRFEEGRKKAVLLCGIVFNVALIGYFKYYDFFVGTVNQIFGTDLILRRIVLPLGISFFTFQQLSFLISVYRGEEKVGNLLDYSIFVTFFPQLVAGPIVLYSEMIPQFQDTKRRYFNAEHFQKGIYYFAAGLCKKALLADNLAVFADNGFAMSDPGMAASWAAAVSYTLQIYFDFSGYSDMAIGLGWMFNIELPFNFLSPYKSRSISEFWRKWHITLGRALSMYIYKPLGGNRKGLFFTCLNLMITFLVSGLWHGAAWTFVVWGMLHGAFVVLERILGDRLNKIPDALRIACTFLIVNALWVLFRAESFAQALTIWKGMIRVQDLRLRELGDMAFESFSMPSIGIPYLLGTVLLLLGIVFFTRNTAERTQQALSRTRYAVVMAALLVISLLAVGKNSVFIYFNF